jgi:hypothetical protein
VRVASGHGKEKSLSKPHLKAKAELLRFFLFQNLADSSTAESRSCQICDLTVVTTVTCQRVSAKVRTLCEPSCPWPRVQSFKRRHRQDGTPEMSDESAPVHPRTISLVP